MEQFRCYRASITPQTLENSPETGGEDKRRLRKMASGVSNLRT